MKKLDPTMAVASYSWAGARILFAVLLVLAVLSCLEGTYCQRRES